MEFRELCTVKTRFDDADFWIVRRGSREKVGMPTREYNPEHYGVRVDRTDLLLPDYLFYLFQYLWSRGFFAQMATGTLSLVNIRKEMIERLNFQVG